MVTKKMVCAHPLLICQIFNSGTYYVHTSKKWDEETIILLIWPCAETQSSPTIWSELLISLCNWLPGNTGDVTNLAAGSRLGNSEHRRSCIIAVDQQHKITSDPLHQ